MAISAKNVVRRSSELVSASLDEATVFMSVASSSYFMLEGSGRDIWSLIDGERSVGEIVTRLTDVYQIEPEACATEVLDFLDSLSGHGMIEIVR